jgi:large subunit ribosomal protein L25
MEALELNATPRTVVGKKVKGLRRQGIIPGVIYGRGIEPVAIQFAARDVEKSISQAGTSTTLQVHVEGIADPYLAIFRDVQYDAIKHNVIHLDLQALDVTRTVRVPISINLVGESFAVTDLGGVLLQLLNEVEVEALPTALVPSIEVDISGMTEIGQSISVADMQIPEGITVLSSPTDAVVQVTYMAEEEEEELPVDELEAGDVEVIGEAREEEEEE